MKKLRLIFETAIIDYSAVCTGYVYSTCVVEIPDDATCFEIDAKPKVVGGEWLKEDEDEKT